MKEAFRTVKENKSIVCPDCDSPESGSIVRRDFLRSVGAVAATAATAPLWAVPKEAAASAPDKAAETAVKALYDTLTEPQKKEV